MMASWKDKDFDGYLELDYAGDGLLQVGVSYDNGSSAAVLLERRKIETLVECLQQWLETGSLDRPA